MINIKDFEKKLDALKISGRVSDIKENDFTIDYTVIFSPEITLNKIKARRDDIALYFGGAAVDIETAGGSVVIKVTRENRDIVPLYDYTYDVADGIPGLEIPFIIGQKEDGTKLYYDLCKMPHLLVGGATGSGKSVFMHNCILSAMYSGAELVLIDVKRVEFSIYEGVPHLCAPICYTAAGALKTLKAVCNVMDSRYKTLQTNGARNISEYTSRGGKMQYMAVFIDELADLLMINSNIEKYLVRIAQLGRAAGVHLITATQRPDASILSGLIRANIPSRVCFAVQKAMDSRIILDMSGGEKLRGRGDGLFLPVGSRNPVRFQTPFIPTDDLLKTIDNARHCND